MSAQDMRVLRECAGMRVLRACAGMRGRAYAGHAQHRLMIIH